MCVLDAMFLVGAILAGGVIYTGLEKIAYASNKKINYSH